MFFCQVAIALTSVVVAAAADAEETGDVRQAVKRLERLERTCAEYAGPNAHKLINAMMREAVRLYEGAKYDPALDSILLASAMLQPGAPRTYYGIQPAMVEIILRWPPKEEAVLLPLDSGKHTWVMVAVTNVSGVRLSLTGMRAVVERAGVPVKDNAGREIESLSPGDPATKTLLGADAVRLAPPAVDPGKTVTFPAVFSTFDRWTEIRFLEEQNKINAPVRNYTAIRANLGRTLRARKRAAAYRAKLAKRAPSKPEAGDPATTPEGAYLLIGYIRNEVSVGKYGIQLVERELAKKHKTFYLRKNDVNKAELRPIGSGTIAELTTTTYKPKQGDGVYVLRKIPKAGG